jgi:hypothetical protein
MDVLPRAAVWPAETDAATDGRGRERSQASGSGGGSDRVRTRVRWTLGVASVLVVALVISLIVGAAGLS